ncbi:MAG: AAA family ATPase [Pseudomonadota bacterium]
MNEIKKSTSLSEETISQLGLKDQPFKDHAGDDYLYKDSHLEMTSNIIMEYLTNPSTTVILTGERGVGKTTFLRKVLRLGYQRYQFCTVRVRKDTNFEFIEDKIKQRWELSSTSVQSPVIDLSIENYVISYLREHPHAVLIIDDAHHLDSTTLDRLLTLKHRIGLALPMGMGFIMAGETPLKVKITELEESNPACTQVYQIDVRPLNKDQTTSYIQHRLSTAGLESESPFSEQDLNAIYESTSGNIRQIHLEAAHLLENGSEQVISNDIKTVPSKELKPNKKMALIIVLVIATLAVILYANIKSNQNNQSELVIPLETPPSIQSNDTSESTLLIENIDNTTDIDPIAEIIEKHENNDDQEVIVDESANNSIDTNAQRDTLLAESIENIEEPAEENKIENTPEKKSQEIHTFGKDWLKNLDASNYTLQVVASKDIKQLESLIKSENLTNEFAHYSKPVNGSTYYVLVVGRYDNREDAVKAVQQLSENLKKNKPWPVALSSIQPHLN